MWNLRASRRLAALAGSVVLLLAGALSVNTARQGSLQPDVGPAPGPAWPGAPPGAVERLSHALAFPTLSEPRDDPDPAPFHGLHAFIRQSYPAVHVQLDVGQGARAIVRTLRGRGVNDLALVLDEGGAILPGALIPGIDRLVALIGIAEKRSVDLDLTVRAAGGHSSAPPAETAIGVLVAPYLTITAVDARWYAPLTPNVYRFRGMPWEADETERVHGPNERIAVEAYRGGIRFLHRLLRNASTL